MTDSSDCESDAGASPSVSSDESATSSSGSSSPTALKIVTPDVHQSTPKKKICNIVTPTTPLGTSLSSVSVSSATPLSAGRKPVRRRQICSPMTPVASTSAASTSTVRPSTSKESQTDSNSKTPTPGPSSGQRKRKRPSSKGSSSQEHSDRHPNHDHGEDPKSSPEKKRKRNKRRRTRSERNFLAGKMATTPGKTPVVTEGEEAVALDAEIDRVLEEKAIKNNLSATNVKSIIRHVITNNMVQKMIMSAVRKKAESGGGDAGGSSDEDGLLEPKMTRAKTKELMGNKQISLWPIVDSPVKISKQPVSETHMLIHNDLPEDSSGDEEYVPKETEISEIAHSDDESSSVASSHASDIGSPAASCKQGVSTRRSMQADRALFTDAVFKTPPPRPTKSMKKNQEDSAISLRTRSKLPLNDTPLEDLERQLVAPDITKDMYDWGTETDNEDYLTFLTDFLNPGRQNQNDANEMDDDADPEYNVMEDDEDLHDREELRMDRAVKVPKKELTQLIAELFESGGILSGDDMDDHDLATLTGITPLANDSGFTDSAGRLADTSLNSTAQDLQNTTVDTSAIDIPNTKLPPPLAQTQEVASGSNFLAQVINEVSESLRVGGSTSVNGKTKAEDSEAILCEQPPPEGDVETPEIFTPPHFEESDLNLLKHQMRQHVQLLAQSYVLTVSTEDAQLKSISKSAKTMVIELKNFARMNGPDSNFNVCNLESAWTLVNFWPHKFIKESPIKKKILEEKYISESGVTINGFGKPKGNYFPRHVVKVIAENNAFIYKSLLPLCYNQKSDQSRCRYSYNEDALLVGGLEELKTFQLSTANMAESISEVLLTVHPPKQLYHRIRNLRKTSSFPYCHPDIKKYFTDGIVPVLDRTVPELSEADKLPLLQRDKRGLSSLWTALLAHIEDSSRDKWEEKMSKDPVTNNIAKQWYKVNSKKKAAGASCAPPTSFTHSETINRVFPNGALLADTPSPHTTTIPVIGANGRVGAIIKIPKLALLVPPTPQEPREGDQAERRPTTSTSAGYQLSQPQEAQEAGETAEVCGQQASNVNIIGLHHLTRRVFKTPVKQNSIVSSEEDYSLDGRKVTATEFKAPFLPEPITVTSTGSYSVLQVVGKPFDLPELSGTSSCEVINLCTLQTPMKKKIFERVAEQNISQQQSNINNLENAVCEQIVDKDDDDESEVPDSPNVILEGTEVELTSDEDEDEEDGNWLRCNEKPEMITLSSDEEGVVENSTVIAADGNNGGSGNGGGNNSSPKKTESAAGGNSSKQGSSTSTTSSTATSSSTVSRKGSSSVGTNGGRGDESDEEGDRRNNGANRKRPLPKDYNGEDDQQGKEKNKRNQSTTMQAPPPPVVQSSNLTQSQPSPSQASHHLQTGAAQSSSSSTSVTSTSSKQQKKARRSPGGQAGSKSKVSSKYNVTPAEKMLEETPNEFEDVADAYMEAYLAKVQSTTEASHPGIYTNFVQMLMEAGETATVNQGELLGKVKALFKDYPDLLREFESFLDPSFNEVASTHENTMIEINLIQMVEKYTENCPALKAKIMNKLKSMKEKPNLTEKDMASALEPFFSGNPVMMEAFKALLPSVYRPHSVSSGMDFEEIELEMEDTPQQRGDVNGNGNNEDLHYEIVKLPDETRVPATNTCPCVCHIKTSDPAFASRSKHCRKCSVKFQDGKIFVHNGRVMRPVSVELTPAAVNPPITKQSGSTGSNLTRSAPPPQSHHHDPRSKKEKDAHHHHPHVPPPASTHHQPAIKPKEFKKEAPAELCVVKPSSSSPYSEKRAVGPPSNLSLSNALSNNAKPSSTTLVTEDTEEAVAEGKVTHTSHQSLQAPPPPNQEKESGSGDDEEWTEDEDRIMLTIMQGSTMPVQMMLRKIASKIPNRTFDQIKSRHAEMDEIIKNANLSEEEGQE